MDTAIPDILVAQARSFKAFIATNHQSLQEIGSVERQAIADIDTLYPSRESSVALSAGSRRSALPPSVFPSDWAIDKTLFRKDLRNFESQIRKLSQYATPITETLTSTTNPDIEGVPSASRILRPPSSVGTEEIPQVMPGGFRESEAGPSGIRSQSRRNPLLSTPAIVSITLSPKDLQNLITAAVTAAMQVTRNNTNNRGNRGNGGERTLTDLRWRPTDIGFFDPDLSKEQGTRDCVTLGNTIW